MRNFTDNNGHSWAIVINVDAIKRVRSEAQVDLLSVVDGKLLQQLADDPVLLCDVIAVLCGEQIAQKQLSVQQFAQAIAGDTIERAAEALLEELIGFFPGRRRTLLQQALAKLRNLQTRVMDHAQAQLNSDELEQQVMAHLQASASGSSSTSLPASSASTPPGSP